MVTLSTHPVSLMWYVYAVLMAGDEGSSKGKGQARKDFATACTRKLIFETVPKDIIYDCYRGVKEVVLTAKCHAERSVPRPDPHRPPGVYDALAEYARKYALSEPLHVAIQISHRESPTWQRQYLSFGCIRLRLIVNAEKANAHANQPHDRITYGFHDMPIDVDRPDAMYMAFMMRGVVHFREGTAEQRPQYGGLAEDLGDVLFTCMRRDRGWLGKIYLCGVPELLLSPEERERAGEDVNERTLYKIYNTFLPYDRPSWQEFAAQVHLVEPNYRRSMAEVADDHKK